MKTFATTLSTLVITIFMCQSSLAHNCTDVVTIESQGLLNYLANVSFIAPHNLSGEWIMDMATDLKFTFLGGWNIWVSSNPTLGKATFRSRQEDIEIVKGDIVTFRFRISWFKGEPRPEVISVIWDGEQICAENGQTLKATKASRRSRRTSDKNTIRNGRFGRIRHAIN